MSRLLPTLLLLCCLPPSAFADGPPVCGVTQLEQGFEPAEGRRLSHAEARTVTRLFRRLDGEWQGRMTEIVCMLSGNHRRYDFATEFKLQGNSNGLRLDGRYSRPGSGATRLFTRRLLIAGGELRVDQSSRAGEVELLQAEPGVLRYAQRYRTVHELPQPASTNKGDGQDSGQGAGAGSNGQDAVAGTANLVSGQQTEAKDPPPIRRSQTREERFTLQASGSHLVLVQDYYTQGVYAGTMRWELRRR